MAEQHFDVIVVGVGGMGSAACFELARRGRRVLGLEQFALGHDRGSSHGQTRIIRTAYYEHPSYVPLLRRSFERWYDLEQRQGVHLLTPCPLLSVGEPEGEMLRGIRASAREHDLKVEALDAAELRRRYPQFTFEPQYAGLLEHAAGYLAVEQCVLAHLREAESLGAEIHAEEPVQHWSADARGVTVETGRGRYRADKLVLTAGPWATELLQDLGVRLTVMRQVAMWFGTTDDSRFHRGRFPLFVIQLSSGYFYGFPLLSRREGLKTAMHYGAPELDHPDAIDRTVGPADEERLRVFLRQCLPAVDGPVRRSSVCIYTLTPDRHFVLDLHPRHGNVAVAAGFSGHGFKFAAVVGEILADLVEQGRTDLPIGQFRVGRPRQ
jgi:sarcosine oxidase